ncbi:MAG: PhnD/SsuA/transferrin family substrate-binding protein [Clostridia bacterium]|nr:PhnD/SsuA/transferrin family substrate-binding protein [Clostridia bacterium]
MNIACIAGPTGVGMSRLMKLSDDKQTVNNYTFTVASSPDEITGKIISGEFNIASVPTNLAAKLYKKSEGKIVMLAANTLGTLSVIENGNSVNSFADLKGKTIYSTGEGSNPEYILRYLLNANGVDPDKDVTISFFAEPNQLAAAILAGNADIAFVPEPVATTVLVKKDTLRRALIINDEWEKLTINGANGVQYENSKIVMGCIVALKSYVDENKTHVEEFLKEYKASIEYVNGNVEDAAALCENYGIIASAAVAAKAIPNCNIVYITGKEMKDSIDGYFNVLFTADPSSIGGAMPGDDFYYNAQ